jgi:hypothetical protein
MNNYCRLSLLAAVVSSCAVEPVSAQLPSCSSAAELASLPGKHIDAAHFEWPAAKASWLNELKTTANKTMANQVLTQLEGLEKDSRKDFSLTGAVLKSSFSGAAPYYINGKLNIAPYSFQLGCYEYICVNKKTMVNDEYENVLRAYVNSFKDLVEAFSVNNPPFYQTPNQYDGKFIRLHYFYRFRNPPLLQAMTKGIGMYQDVDEASVKQGSRNTYITRHWYITRPGAPLLRPVTRKEYLQGLLEYYEREKLGVNKILADAKAEYDRKMNNLKSRVVKASYERSNEEWAKDYQKTYTIATNPYRHYTQQCEARAALVTKALQTNNAEWLAKPALVNPRPGTITISIPCDATANGQQNVDVMNADTKADAQQYGSYAFTGFWDDRNGDVLYQLNDDYFAKGVVNPAKPQLIELAYRYVKIPMGQKLVENFTEHFDFGAVAQLLK